jgi:protein TonB
MSGFSQGSRLVCIALAVGVHAAAAAAFMMTPKREPPPPPEGVEIEMLAEITSVVAEEITPSVAAEAEAVEEATEAQPGESASQDGEIVEEVAVLKKQQTEVAPEQIEKPVDQPEAERAPEVEATPDAETPAAETQPEQASISMPVELETPVIEAPQAPVLFKKRKPVAKAVQKKAKTEKRRAAVAGSAVTKDGKRKGASQAQSSGGNQSSSQYRSIVQARLSARRGAISSSAGSSARGRVIIAFSIGASGRVTSVSVSKSSGDARLDAAARSVVAATSFPPPPGGSFRSGIPIAIE